MSVSSAKSIFQAANVQSALLIDDVYDVAIPSFGHDDLERAFQLIEGDDAAEKAFVAASNQTRPNDTSDLKAQITGNAALAGRLSEALTDDDDALHVVAAAIYGTAADDLVGRRKPLLALNGILRDLGIRAEAVGSGRLASSPPKHPLIFLDYYLGENGGTPSIERSRQRIMELVSHYSANERPIVVLMSSKLNKERVAREFRDKAELLGCQFHFALKEEFEKDPIQFVSVLADLVEFIGQSRTIGGFVDAWKAGLDGAFEGFLDGIRELDLQDYFYARDKLGVAGHGRFGEHMSALFDGFLRKLVEDRPELKSAIKEMNRLKFDKQPPNPFMPSATVARLAHAASFQDIEADDLVEVDGKLNIELGDMFYREMKPRGRPTLREATIVISQACDLEHGKTDTVLMIDGIVTARSSKKSPAPENERTVLRVDLFKYEKNELMIEWDARNMRAVPVSEFQKFLKDTGFQRVARLRSLQALSLQQKFASHLTRVGLPEGLPIYRQADVEVLFKTKTGKIKTLLSIPRKSGELACIVGDESRSAVLMNGMFSKIRDEVSKIDAKDCEAAKLDQLKNFFSDVGLLRELRITKLTEGKSAAGFVSVYETDGPWQAGKNFRPQDWFVINLFVT